VHLKEAGMADDDDESRGAALRRRAQGAKADQLQALLVSLDPGVGRWADDFVFGEVWSRPGLDFEARMLVAIASLATQGKSATLRNYAFGALQGGVSARKIHETIVELVVYAGFPTATNMLYEWVQVLNDARAQGIPIKDDVQDLAEIHDNS
jgi:4-carboxymuconolactone decarboxylase